MRFAGVYDRFATLQSPLGSPDFFGITQAATPLGATHGFRRIGIERLLMRYAPGPGNFQLADSYYFGADTFESSLSAIETAVQELLQSAGS